MSGLLFGTALLASFLGGVVALLAPCCVSVMLPAYFAAGFRRRSGILAATIIFAAGVATIIVPIGIGANALSAALSAHHLVVFSIGGGAMVLGGVAVLAGWMPKLPMPSGRAPAGHGIASVYGLGVFSGAASACCAPVLAGVAVLSGATASFPAALAVSLTYVAGMVAPLCLLSLVWDRRDWGSSRLLHGRTVHLLGRQWSLGTLLSGLVLVGMGALTLVTAVTGPSMPTTGWRVTLSADLQHAASVTTRALRFVPGWVFGLLLLGAVVAIARQVRRRRIGPATETNEVAEVAPPEAVKATIE